MPFDASRHIDELRANGLTRIANVFSAAECSRYVQTLNEIAERLALSGKINFNGDVYSVVNYFRHAPEMLPLVFNQQIDAIFKEVIDRDYVLMSASAINRSCKSANPARRAEGDNWHTDSRYVGGKRISENFNFVLIVMLEDFTLANAPTEYVPRSHLDRSIPDRYGNYDGTKILGEAGTMVIFDAGIWHRGGSATNVSRWSIFNVYSPWFVKPYHRYQDMLSRDRPFPLTEDLRRIFHFDSTPPIDEDEGLATLSRVRALEPTSL
jgi:ectoine hydroxylase-related dioxygenase (phytanoyl-CoA dioxygenase family)